MKTTLMSLTIISLFFSFICCNKQETIEDKIKKEFKIYVNENFGDPNDLKEVVSIDLKDTVSYRPIYEIVSMTKGLYEKGKEQDDSIFYLILFQQRYILIVYPRKNLSMPSCKCQFFLSQLLSFYLLL